jgi:energy-coupling factor transporter ATP-binding protein EcfA2
MTTIEQNPRFAGLLRLRDRRTCSLEVRTVVAAGDDGSPLLDGVSLELEPQNKICIVGSADEGQAALLSLLVGQRRPDSGSIFLNGLDIEVMSRDSIAKTVGLVPKDPWIKAGTITENISFGMRDVPNHQIEWAARVANVTAFARYLPAGLDTVIGDGEQGGALVLSAGQCRRIALARVLLRNPSILILEEPTSGMTTGEEILFLDSLHRAATGRTLIVASHRVTVARKVDRVLVLQDGKLVPYNESGTKGTIHDHAKLWDVRVPTVEVPATTRSQILRPTSRSPRPVSEPWGVAPGTLLAPGYMASGLLGRSSHNDVWAAWSNDREAPVRIKIPSQRPVTYHAYEQLARESRILSHLSHPGMTKVYHSDLEAEMPYAVFEFFDSPSLASVVRRQRTGLDALDVLYIGFELAGTLNYLHHRGYAHLSVRPRHVRTRADTIVISDFGDIRPIGTAIPAGLGSGNGRRGEHHMVAPEQRPGATVDAKMDIYSLGALMHVAAAGRIVTRATTDGPRLVPFSTLLETAPVSLTGIVDRMLADDPVDRPDAEEILKRFRRVLPESLYRPRIADLDARPHLQLVVSNN